MAKQKSEILLHHYQETLEKVQGHIVNTKKIITRHKIEMAWSIGKIIDEYFLNHDEKIYGRKLISNLSVDVSIHEADLYKMRSFFKAYPSIPQDEEFNWTHYRILSGIKEGDRRLYFENLTKENSLNSRQLQDEINKAKKIENKKETKVVLTANRGQIFTYEVAKIVGRDSFFIDLGFGVLRQVDDVLPQSLREEGVRVAVSKEDKDYSIKKSTTTSKQGHTYIALLDRVVDGDTIRVSLDLGFKTYEKQILRLAKINAPELSSEEGQVSFQALKEILAPCSYLIIKTLKTDIFGRYVADIFLPATSKMLPQISADEGDYLNQKLVDLGLVQIY